MAIDLRGRSSVSFYDTFAEFPIIGSDIVLYVDRDTLTMYIWNGITYEPFSSGSGGTTITVVANYAALPDPTTVSNQFYWCSATQGTYWLPGSLGGNYRPSGLYYSNGVSWEYTPTPYNATQSVVNTGTNDDQFITPKTFTDSTQLAAKVPYTGAIADVDLGNNDLNAEGIKIKGTAGNGHLNLKHQSSGATAGGGESVIYADNSGNPKWKNDGNAVQNVMLENAPITPGTYYKVTVDAKGLVTSGTLSYQMLFGNPNLSISGTLTRHFSFSEGIASNSAINRYIPFVQDVTVSRFFITTITAQPAGSSSVFTVQKNGVDTGIVITIPAGSSAGSYSELVTTATFNAGDNISIKWVNNSASTSCVVAGTSIGFL